MGGGNRAGNAGADGGRNFVGGQRTTSEGNRVYPLTDGQMNLYTQGRTTLADFQTPKMVSVVKPTSEQAGSRLFVAAFDGTGNDADHDPLHSQTNVAHIHKEILASNFRGETGGNIAVGYLRGPGTQGNVLPLGHEDRDVGASVSATRDGMRGSTTQERAERMYGKFCKQATLWKDEHPGCQISVSSIGFSRGAEEAALFTHLVHDRGIRDATVMGVPSKDGSLVPAGQTAQAVVLFDPVATGATEKMDRHLPSSVISGIQLYAGNEQRSLFKGDPIIPAVAPGAPATKEKVGEIDNQSRLAGIMLPGSHSDVGGSYALNGASARAGNFGVDYLNSLADKPFINNIKEAARADTYRHNSSDGGGTTMWAFYKVDNTRSMYQHWTGPMDRMDTTPGSRAYIHQQPPDQVDKALRGKFEFTGSIERNSRLPPEAGSAQVANASSARPGSSSHPDVRSTDSMLNNLSRAASSNNMHMADAALSNASNPALAARAQGAQALSSQQRQQAQKSTETQPQREPASPSLPGRQPGR